MCTGSHGAGTSQTGLAAIASLADYASNRIRKHELTTPAKEDDRVRQIEAVNAQTGPVMIAYPAAPQIDAMLAEAASGAPAVDMTADDGVRHQLWVIGEDAKIAALSRAVDALPALYIADGHHRSAAAARVAKARGGEGSHSYFLAVLFPQQQMTILDYNRVLRDLNGSAPSNCSPDWASATRSRRAIDRCGRVLRRNSAWCSAAAGTGSPCAAAARPVRRAPPTRSSGCRSRCSSRNIIEPIFGITDPRTDKRIDFVGGGRGLDELERLVSSGAMAAAFALYPTQMSDLMAVADAGKIMPPKSTWFEPKLADGMVSHVLD